MKLPIVKSALVMLIISLSFAVLIKEFFLLSLFALLFLFAFFVYKKVPLKKLICLAMIIFLVAELSYIGFKVMNINQLSHTNENITAVAVSDTKIGSDGNMYFTGKIINARDNCLLNTNTCIFCGENINAGDKVILSADIYPLGKKGNLSLYANKTFSFTYADVISLERRFSKVYTFESDCRKYIKNLLERYSKNTDVLYALISGDKALIDTELYESVRKAGVSHVIVVSGMHMAVITSSFIVLMNFFRIGRVMKAVLLLFLTFGFCVICGFSYSVMRAGITNLVYAVCILIKRQTNPCISIADSLVITILINPLCVFSVSYQLSYTSAFAIIVLTPYLYERYFENIKMHFILRAILVNFLTSFSAVALTLPIVIYYFSSFSLVGIFTNFVTGFAVTFMVVLLFITLLLSPLDIDFVLFLLIKSADVLALYFKSAVNFFASLPFSEAKVKYPVVTATTIFIVYALLYYFAKRRDNRNGCYKRTNA